MGKLRYKQRGVEYRVTSSTPCNNCPRSQYNNANQQQRRVLIS